MPVDPDLDREYSPSSVAKHPADHYIHEYAELSRATREALGPRLVREAYGPGSDEYALVARHSPDAPLLVFIHGGYWRALSADECCMWAGEALDMGFSFASINYTLAPTATLDRIVAQCRMAIDWLVDDAGLSPRRTVVAGSSAGGHLAAMVTTARPAPQRCDAAVMLSGVFDLRPLVRTSVNDAVMLTTPDAVRLGPANLPVTPIDHVATIVGDRETVSFKQQSANYAAKLADAGVSVTNLVVDGRDHFDLIYDLVSPGTLLGDTTISLLQGQATRK